MIEEITSTTQKVIKDLYLNQTTVEVVKTDPKFGDYTSNIALKLSSVLDKRPRDIAEEIRDCLLGLKLDYIDNISVEGPGFLNFVIKDQALIALVNKKPTKHLKGKKILVEYSDPNPFKPLHAGHLYTTLVGDVIARIIEKAGAEVVRLNYGGDVGLHVGKSMWSILKYLGGEYPDKLNQIDPADRAKWLGEMYVAGNNAYKLENTPSKQEIIEINKRVYALHTDKDETSDFAKIYYTCRQWSYNFFDQLYKDLEVVPFDRYIPESEAAELGLNTVREQQKRGVYEESEGAVIFRGENYGLHNRVFINSHGLPTYEAKDVGLMLIKWRDYHYDLSYYITGSEQSQYMKVMYKSVEQFEPEAATRAVSLTNGMIKLSGGVKMSSRLGNAVSADDVLKAATEASIELKGQEDKKVTLAAIKYSFLKVKLGSNINYDARQSVSIEGNSGPYLQYAHARAISILNKAALSTTTIPDELDSGEKLLLSKICEYVDVLEAATNQLLPSLIANYLYQLTSEFNRFYENNKVIGSDRQSQRLWLVSQYANRLKSGLNLLGIKAPDRM